jgi:hypothetical protein
MMENIVYRKLLLCPCYKKSLVEGKRAKKYFEFNAQTPLLFSLLWGEKNLWA